MPLEDIDDVDQLRKICDALLNRVESAMDQQGNAFSLFQTAINLEGQVKRRTDELTLALRNIEKTNADLARAKEASDRANLSKTRFLAAASHDVLQPLNAALLSISVLADMQESETGKNLVTQIERSLETMSDLINTLIDISKLDAGVANPRIEMFQLIPFLEGLKTDFEPVALERNLKFKLAGNKAVVVRSDRTMLRRILQNLISNALRYTTEGGVLIGVRRRSSNIQIEVVDTGFGIPENQRDNIFEEFNRGALPSGHQREASHGLGLGLSIVRRMAKTLDHQLDVMSTVGSGSRFLITVPAGFEPEEKSATSTIVNLPFSTTGFANKRVLLLENDPAGIQAMQLLLESWECETRVASTMEETARILTNKQWLPDVIVADQNLDYGDQGTDAIAMVREFLGKQVPALIVTADATKELEQTVREFGLKLMKKPLKPAQFRALLSHIISTSVKFDQY